MGNIYKRESLKRESLKWGMFKTGNLWEVLINQLQINLFVLIIPHAKA